MRVVTKHCAWQIGKRTQQDASHRAFPLEHPERDRAEEIELPSPGREPSEEVELRSELRRRAEHFSKLKRDERIALALLAIGYSYAEIQQRFDWTHTKVNRCVSEGRAALRALEGGGNDPSGN